MKVEREEPLDAHLAVKDEKSSCTILEVESLDWISFSASFSIVSMPSFPACQHWEYCIFKRYPLLLPKNTSNEGNTNVALHPLPWHRPESKSGGVQRASHSYRRRRGATSTCKLISWLACRKSDLAYVFHAPSVKITTPRLSAAAASVRYCLNEVSNNLRLEKSSSKTRTVLSCLWGALRGASRSNFHNHRLARPPGVWCGGPCPRSLRLRIRVERMGRPPTYALQLRLPILQ